MDNAIETLKEGLQDALLGMYKANQRIKKATDDYTKSVKEMISHEDALEKLGYTFTNEFYRGFIDERIYSKVKLTKIKK